MSNPDQPVNGGLTPTQIRALNAPINGNAVRIHPHHNWPYVPGVIVVNHLNKVFGFDGWSCEILEVLQDQPQLVEGKNGKQQFRVMVSVRVRLHIHAPGGRTFYRDGVGADEKVSKNLIDCVDNAQASAYTFAIRSAAILLGQQFGLAVMRMGKDVPWQKLCVGNDPQWPDFAAGVGQPDEALTEAANDIGDDGTQMTAAQVQQPPQQQQAQRSQQQPPAQAQQQAQAPAQQQASQQAQASQGNQPPQDAGWSAPPGWDARGQQPNQSQPPAQQNHQPQQPAQPAQSDGQAQQQGQAGQQAGGAIDREALIGTVRETWKQMGSASAMPIFRSVCKAHGLDEGTHPMMVGRPIDNGGLADNVLVALLEAMQKGG